MEASLFTILTYLTLKLSPLGFLSLLYLHSLGLTPGTSLQYLAVTEKDLLSMVRQMVGHRNSQGEANRYRDKGDRRTEQKVCCVVA